MDQSVRDLKEKVNSVLVWLGMAHKGDIPLLPEKQYQINELRGRCLELREAIRRVESD